MAAASITAPSPRPRALPIGPLARRTVGDVAAVVEVLIGTAIVLVAAERGSTITSIHNGTFTSWFAGPFHGWLPSLTTAQGALVRGLGAAQLLMPVSLLPLPAAYWVWKVAATLTSLGLLAAVWGCARRLDRPPAQAVALAGLYPLVRGWALGGTHNDMLMMGLIMTGCLLALGRRNVAGGAVLAAAVAIKASAGLLAPVVALGLPRRWRVIGGAAAGGLVLAGITALLFGPHLPDIRDQARLVSAFSIPNLLGYAAGRGGADATVLRIARIVMVAGLAACAVYAWRTRRWATAGGWAALVANVTASWLVAWYVLWALPFVALSRSRVLRATTLVLVVWYVLVGSWVAGPWLHAHGFTPHKTPVGRANYRFELSVLQDPPLHKMREQRRPSGRGPMLPRLHGRVAPPSARRTRPATPHVAGRGMSRRAAARGGRRAGAQR